MDKFSRPRIVVSKCLGFGNCRFDGSVIEDNFVAALKDYVDFIPVCPEMEIGLGVPRKTIRTVLVDGKKELYCPANNKILTEDMYVFADSFLRKVGDVHGFIFRHRSPSCGVVDSKVYKGMDSTSHVNDSGLFAEVALDRFDCPIEDDGRLKNFLIRENFLIQLFTLFDYSNVSSLEALVEFHLRNSFLFLAYDSSLFDKMSLLISEGESHEGILKDYGALLKELFKGHPEVDSWIQVSLKAFNSVREKLSSEEVKFFEEKVEEYREGRIPLSVLTNLIDSYAVRFKIDALDGQSFLKPHPIDLLEITDSGKGRDR